MARSNGGIIGATNQASFGKCTVTTFTSSCSVTTQPGTQLVQTVLVGGGAGGGKNTGGGGGAGGLILSPSQPVSGNTSYPIVIGAGGSGSITCNGNDTTGFSLIAKGGGYGGCNGPPGNPGGSGGGGGGGGGTAPTTGGTATQPIQPGNSGTFGFGNSGGPGGPCTAQIAGGGGGACSAGQPGRVPESGTAVG